MGLTKTITTTSSIRTESRQLGHLLNAVSELAQRTRAMEVDVRITIVGGGYILAVDQTTTEGEEPVEPFGVTCPHGVKYDPRTTKKTEVCDTCHDNSAAHF